MTQTYAIESDVPLARMCTLELGGPARLFARVATEEDLLHALAWAASWDHPTWILGGGSNVVVADGGVEGLVLRPDFWGISAEEAEGGALVTARAGEGWDAFVAWTVSQGLAGLECLSGIPGTVGATPIQNVGAYGQEVSETIVRVRAYDRALAAMVDVEAAECGFGYRDSRFRREPGRWIVTAVTFRLTRANEARARYAELRDHLGKEHAPLAEVREAVILLRKRKSMVIEAEDENRRSVGSFFVNPVLSRDRFDVIVARALTRKIVSRPEDVPHHAQNDGRVKVPAAWLIERAGFERGHRRGPVGISSRHTLALVHHGGGTTREVVELATDIRDGVEAAFAVRLAPEPVFLGFDAPPL